jgi:DNA polymerase family A
VIIGYFGVQSTHPKGRHDRSYLPKLSELIGPHHVKLSLSAGTDPTYFAAFAAKVKAAQLDAVIVSDPAVLQVVIKSLPDFKPSFNGRGQEKELSLNDYHGSLVRIKAAALGGYKDVEVLFLNPLEHLRTVPEAAFIFKRFISKLTAPAKWFPQTGFTWELATPDSVQRIYNLFESATLIAADIETAEGNIHRSINCSGYCALFADGSTHSCVIPTTELWGTQWMAKFNALAAPKIFQNGLYDNAYYMRWNAPVSNWLYDTNILFHCWYSELPKRLDFITAFAIREIRFWKDDGKSGGSHAYYEYNARDCWATMNAWLSMIHEAPQWAINNYLIEFPLVFPCLHCELDGLAIDEAEFKLSVQEVEGKLKIHEDRLAAWIHPNFNPGSHIQVKKLLFNLGYRDSEGGLPDSSDDKSLTAAGAMSPFNAMICEEIQSVREYRKLLSTYLVKEKFWNDRLFYKLNPAGTDTGRLASTESSFWCGLQIQNMPRGKEVKRFLRADRGYLLGENDFAQSEARCVGYISGCLALIELVEGPHDYHSWNAQSFFGVPYEQIYDEAAGKQLNKSLRDLSKRTNHGANYNMGARVMLETMGPKKVMEAKRVLKLPEKMGLLQVCQFLLDAYARTYPEVKVDYQNWLKREVSIQHKLVSALGWTRYTFLDPSRSKPELNSLVAHAPQNLSVGIINPCFYDVWRRSVYGDFRRVVRLKAQIHDSILYQYDQSRPDLPEAINAMMRRSIPVKDIKGVTRTMVIPPDISAGKTHWGMLK